MSLYNVPTLPHLFRRNGQVSIPPSSAESYYATFGSVLPPVQQIESYWGITSYYLIKPSHLTPNSKPSRRVVLVHGGGTPAIGLMPLATLLAANPTPTTVLMYDFWGHGLSSTPLTTHVPGLYHSQLLHLFTHLQWPSAHFLGYSFGGIISTSFAQYHSSLMESLTLVAPVGLIKKADMSVWARFVNWGGWGYGWEGISARRIYAWIGPGPVEEGWEQKFKEKGLDAIPREAVQVWERDNHGGHVASLVSGYRYGGIYDSHEIYAKVAKGDVKTLVILGGEDHFFGGEYMKKELDSVGWRGEVKVVEGVGHGVIAERPKDVEELMVEFWDGLGVGEVSHPAARADA